MKYIKRAIALTGLVLLMTVSSVFAQSDRQTVVNIPFNFTVGGKALPAGKYLIRRNRRDSETVWVIQAKDGGETAMLLTRPVQSKDNQDVAKFVFRQYDDLYILTEFWTAGTNSGREIQVTDQERALTKALAVKPQVYVLIDRGQ